MTGSAWTFEFSGWVPDDEGRREALCTLGNGVFGTRGAAAEFPAGGIHYPGTYAAGFFNRLVSEVEGRTLEHESLPNLPNWLPLRFRAEAGPWLGSGEHEIVEHGQTIDMGQGMLRRRTVVRDAQGRETTVEERRLVHMGRPHLAAQEWTVTPRNWSGRLTVRAAVDAAVENRNVTTHLRLAGRHLRLIEAGTADPDTCWVEVETTQSRLRCAQAARIRISVDAERTLHREEEEIGYDMSTEVGEGSPVVVEKVVAPAELNAAVEAWVGALLKAGPRAVRLQKALVRQWEEAPLGRAIEAGIDCFAEAYATDEPVRMMRAFLTRPRPAR